MNSILLIPLSCFVLCGCSKKHAASAPPASTLVEAGKDVAWSDGYVLHVTTRDGASLEGIRMVKTETNGQVATITAQKGTLEPKSSTQSRDGIVISTNILTLTLQDAQIQGVTTQTIKELTLFLRP